jgi:hypothetical protein
MSPPPGLPFPTIRVAERRVTAGWLVSAAGWMSIYGCVLAIVVLMGLMINADGVGGAVPGFGIFAAFYIFAFPRLVKLIVRGRRMRAPRALDILSRADQPYVVLLRSFDDDDLIDPSFPATAHIAPGRYEERLVNALRPIGPTVALGAPEEPQPELGAARLYVTDAHWHAAIKHLVEKAAAVLAIVGRSQGLWWEIDLALSRVPSRKLLFFFPYPAAKPVRDSYLRTAFLQNPVFGRWLRRSSAPEMEAERERRYQSFRERFGPMFKGSLPTTLDGARFVDLDNEGHARLVDPLRPPLWTRLATMNFSPRLDIPFASELRPFVRKIKGGIA